MRKVILIMIMLAAGANAKYIQGIDNGSFNVYKNDGQVIRQFTTTKDGYINIVPSPWYCKEKIMLLDYQNKVIGEIGLNSSANLNVAIRAGQYFIQIIPREDCKINIALPE